MTHKNTACTHLVHYNAHSNQPILLVLNVLIMNNLGNSYQQWQERLELNITHPSEWVTAKLTCPDQIQLTQIACVFLNLFMYIFYKYKQLFDILPTLVWKWQKDVSY